MAEVATGNSRGRIVLASLIGTTIEYYDFYVYLTAAVLVFPALYFGDESPTLAILSSLSTFAVAFFARPLGAVVFGHFGDKHGRKSTLVASLLTMGIATLLIGLVPSSNLIGDSAALILAVLRFAQGFGLGGEWTGAALVAVENAPANRRGLYGTLPQLGGPLGFFLANSVFLLAYTTLPHASFVAWGWRLPFLLSAILIIVALYVRLKLVESPYYQVAVERREIMSAPIVGAFRYGWRSMLLGSLAMACAYVLFYLVTTFALTYGIAAKGFVPGAKVGLGYSSIDFLVLLTVTSLCCAVATLISGYLSDRLGRRRVLLVGIILVAFFGYLFQPLLAQAHEPLQVVLFLSIGFTLAGVIAGPMGAFLTELFPTNVRYTASAFTINVAAMVGASLAPLVGIWLWDRMGALTNVGTYLTISALLSLLVFASANTMRERELNAPRELTRRERREHKMNDNANTAIMYSDEA